MKQSSIKNLAESRRARLDYDMADHYEAGIELLGHEAKSAKSGKFDLAGSYVLIRGGEAWLLNSRVPPYQVNNTPADYDPGRRRRLLLRRAEIKELAGRLEQKSFLLVPLRAYVKNSIVKLDLGLRPQ